ncbi:MAG: 5'-deoxynucleotidase [Bacteroidales bacterium]|nr:5'-deoxynucleotidase [Clostridium sp.]MCM1203890.1 5'-deoxynucleotidase [Bacteroidales bacterium]
MRQEDYKEYDSPFFAMLSRMKYINRWALMRNSYPENISEHSLEVGMLAHALVLISNKQFGNRLNAERAALIGMYHDCTEIITGDMPTPIKYYNKETKEAYKSVEKQAAHELLSMLPEYLYDEYESILFPQEEEEYLWKLVKAADRLSAYIKCIEEEKTGNREFSSAKAAVYEKLTEMDLPEVRVFLRDFAEAYKKTLDELKM